jgi:DNA repair protein SbcC/Rad50
MFDFFFKRSASKKKQPSPNPISAQNPQNLAAAAESAKLSAMAKADSFKENEAGAVAFILQCDFADARLKAAAHIHTLPALEKVQKAMRNVDRRVAKLMQGRLDALQQQEALNTKMQECLVQAQRLLQEPHLMPNQVAELDRKWQSLETIAVSDQASFDNIRTKLSERLAAQTDLQRSVLDTLNKLRSLGTLPEMLAPAEILQKVEQLEADMLQHQASPEMASLPKQLLIDFSQEQQRIKTDLQQKQTMLEQRFAAVHARQEILATWEATDPASLLMPDLRRTWRNLPTLLNDVEALAPLQARFDVLIEQISIANPPPELPTMPAEERVREENPQENSPEVKKQFSEVLEALEKALEDGYVQAASEHDKALRAAPLKSVRPSDTQSHRLGHARSELSRLQGWAKWGGNVSREELIKTVEELPTQALSVTDLAKKVGSLRERWKSLDAASGPAPRSLWERFDAVCNLAYEPAAAHFKKLAEERQQNMETAQTMIAQVRQFASDSGLEATEMPALQLQDWKNIAVFCQRSGHAWHRLGIIDRKDRKRLDVEFKAAMAVLEAPLAAQQQIEIQRREALIAEVEQINAADRSALKALQGCQERWQELAKSLPLERRDEQALWLRFRSACDSVFARRKESAEVADAGRKQNAILKEAICAELEAALSDAECDPAKQLRESRSAWDGIGPLPRASESAIIQRYESALTALQARRDAVQRVKLEAQSQALRAKMQLCQAIEAAVVNGLPLQDDWVAQWQALPVLKSEFEQPMQRRFDAAVNALQSGNSKYAGELEQNRVELSQELLRLEILAGQDSPPELARERLKMQVDVLQLSLRTGQKALGQEERFMRLCSLPAMADDQTKQRIDQLLNNMSALAAS